MLTAQEKIQYSRHLLLSEIGEGGQQKLKNAKVLVIGAGGLGCPILQYLTAAGVGHIGIIDHDVVDQTNLQRQILYTIADIGKPKAQIAADRLSKLNPFISFNVFTEQLSKHNALELFKPFDIIVDGSDNFPTRYLVNDSCVLTDKPLVFGSIFKFQGQVSVLNYKEGPTYRCLFPDPPSPEEVPNCSAIGVLGVLPGIIGSLQANEVIKIITGIGDVLAGKLLYLDALTMHQQIVNFKKTTAAKVVQLEDNYDTFCGIQMDIKIKQIEAVEFQKDLSKYQILDVRTHIEYEKFNIGGTHIPIEEISEKAIWLKKDQPIVVCCQSGIRSEKAIQIILKNRDDLELINLKGGFSTFSD